MKKLIIGLIFLLNIFPFFANACETPISACDKGNLNDFPIISNSSNLTIYNEINSNPAVKNVIYNFAKDIEAVGGIKPNIVSNKNQLKGNIIIIGVLNESGIIKDLISQKKINAREIVGKWEAYKQIIIDNPYDKLGKALVIIGSDRRGAVYGTYNVSEKIGVSPLYWWADVPIKTKNILYLKSGSNFDMPVVKYRGIFINDEDPGLKTWAINKFGGVNSKMYQNVFELILRLKGNYLWPAMWSKAFNVDDPKNMVLADQMGIIMGTSHHEPMMRAHEEWYKNNEQGITGGKWNYNVNSSNLRKFWESGIERMYSRPNKMPYDSLVTIGMRGDGDEAMSEHTAIDLLENIVKDQRSIIEKVSGKPAYLTPQVWALYKEVQDYYDQGMEVPDDVLLLFADDNWGQIRRLPKNRNRKGGYGIYYHFDYVGIPRNYKWLNTIQIKKTWQQMNLAYENGVDKLWIVNVGDIKPVEYPLNFFLDMAWNPKSMTLSKASKYPIEWSLKNFGEENSLEIADLITRYGNISARRKPELVDENSFKLGDISNSNIYGGEFGLKVEELLNLENDMEKTKSKLNPEQKEAYFQIIEHPIKAITNQYKLYYYAALNNKLASMNDARSNAFADLAEQAFANDQNITDQYHKLKDGKWNGMMLQTHIGYTNWQQPEKNIMPKVIRITSVTTINSENILNQLINSNNPNTNTDEVIKLDLEKYNSKTMFNKISWEVINDLGKSNKSIVSVPQFDYETSIKQNISIDYDFDLSKQNNYVIQFDVAPTIDTSAINGLKFAYSIDNSEPKIIDYDLKATGVGAKTEKERNWWEGVKNNSFLISDDIGLLAKGKHTIKIWRISANVVLQGINLNSLK